MTNPSTEVLFRQNEISAKVGPGCKGWGEFVGSIIVMVYICVRDCVFLIYLRVRSLDNEYNNSIPTSL